MQETCCSTDYRGSRNSVASGEKCRLFAAVTDRERQANTVRTHCKYE